MYNSQKEIEEMWKKDQHEEEIEKLKEDNKSKENKIIGLTQEIRVLEEDKKTLEITNQ